MSVGQTGLPSQIAGAPLAQGQGDIARNQTETANAARQTSLAERAEKAAGIGEAEQDEQASDRDADGRRIWEQPPNGKSESAENVDEHRTPDPSGDRGTQLDLSG